MKPFLMQPEIPSIELSCAGRQNAHYRYSEGGLSVKQIEVVLTENPVQAGQNVQIRNARVRHVHKYRDLTTFIYRGCGTMTVGSRRFDGKDSIHVAGEE